MSASIALAVLQIFAIVVGGGTLRTVQDITNVFAVHYVDFINRAQGMTYEPSWLATQITLLLLPWLVARSVSGQDFVGARTRKRVSASVLGGFLLVLVGLLCAGSRFGIASALGIIILCGLGALWKGRVAAALALFFIVAIGIGGSLVLRDLRAGAGTGYVATVLPELATFTAADFADPNQLNVVTDALSIAGRVATWQAAAEMWIDHPVSGVSLGNGYRYFGVYMPDWALTTDLFAEGENQGELWLDPYAPEKGNAKNLLLRLLAETGALGTILFVAFFLKHIFYARGGDRYYDAFRLAAGAALVFNWLNTDTFADPAMWILLATLHAAGRLRTELGTERAASPILARAS